MSIILVTAKADTKDVVAGLDAGADEYLTKPVDQAALMARVRSTLRLKALHDRVLAQAADLASWNQTLEQRVAEQVAEIERIGRLKRFLPPQIAKLVVSSGHERMLESHRRQVTVLFCDLRGFTAFSEVSEPEEVILVLREYHTALGFSSINSRDARAIHGRWFPGSVQRSVAMSRTLGKGRANGGRDAQ
jgi:DNA-binding NarL/FixJ family response regulator